MRAVATLSEEWTTEDHKKKKEAGQQAATPAAATDTSADALTDDRMTLPSSRLDTCHPRRRMEGQGVVEMKMMMSLSH